MNYLMLSVGRRGELMKDFRLSMEEGSRIIATDNSPYAPALYFADKQYLVIRFWTSARKRRSTQLPPSSILRS